MICALYASAPGLLVPIRRDEVKAVDVSAVDAPEGLSVVRLDFGEGLVQKLTLTSAERRALSLALGLPAASSIYGEGGAS